MYRTICKTLKYKLLRVTFVMTKNLELYDTVVCFGFIVQLVTLLFQIAVMGFRQKIERKEKSHFMRKMCSSL